VCHSHRLQSWFPSIGASLGYAYANADRAPEGLALLEQAIAQADRIHLRASYSMWLTYRAHACLRLGRTDEAQRVAEAALDRARRQSERGHEAWALFLLASIGAATASSTAEDIKGAFGHAIDSARALGMRPLLALCHSGLADAYGHLGRPEQASAERVLAQHIRREIGMMAGDLDATAD
jgi:tetratricopeptide (TPR) repeat protein